jgi:hypothetical protein
MKKKWEKPKLVVLVRGKPEEAVLELCKTSGHAYILGPLVDWYCGQLIFQDCKEDTLS